MALNKENIRWEPDKRKCCGWKYESVIAKGKEMVGKCDVWRKTESIAYEEGNSDYSI